MLGQSVEGADGWVEIGGGTLSIGGDLRAGAFLRGGSFLRFLNPGAAAAVQVGGRLDLERATLGLTFDTNYLHTPGATIPLLEYATRTGQFINARAGDEFNFSNNRFRINYDVPVASGRKQITLTLLTNWPAAFSAPNVIFILADDQGYADLRLQGDARYPTPELEKLAASGARFTDAYVCGGVCHPSRSAILTGRYQQRIGTDNNLSGPAYNGTAAAERTVPQRLQSIGYRTYGIGKWHMGNTAEFLPNQRGFDRWYGINAGSRPYYATSGEDNLFQNDMELRSQDEGQYVADRIGNACVEFIDEQLTNHPGQPFYIYCAFTSVHAPMDISPSDARFTRLRNEFGLSYSNYAPGIVFSGSTAATTQQNRYELAAMTLALDENIGKIVNKLNVSGLASNTIVIYLNDNGGAGWNASAGGNYSYNTPLRGYKGGSMTEGSIRVPAAIQWPGKIPAGQVITNPVNSLDFMATAVNASGNVVPAARNGLEGLDLLPLLRNGAALPAERGMFWRAGDVRSGGSAARMGDWKILAVNSTGVFKLYNLISDIGENVDVSGANPAIFAELKERFAAWNSANIEPFYGGSDMIVDAALERSGIRSGYRICHRGASPAYLTASLRKPLSMTTNFSLGFYLRGVETNHAGGEQLWFALGDTTNRANLIRAGVDFGAGQLRLIEGKTGGSASVPLTDLPSGFTAGTLRFSAATKQLAFTLGGTNVSLVLGGNYGV
ncbi:MAG: sulfatase-like hydrolase/transferase, partial [Verrucomicrobiota bacterium]